MRDPSLFVPERRDGVDPSGTQSGNQRGDKGNGREQEDNDQVRARIERTHIDQLGRNQPGRKRGETQTNCDPGACENERTSQYHDDDRACRCAERNPYPNLVRTFSDVVRDDAIYAGDREKQPDAGE